MALTAVAFAKAMRRRQIMIATSSIGPGCTNMVTAAAVAHANRLPLLLLSGDTFQHRIVDPVLQQIEQFNDPTITAADTFKPVTRYWDRITKPEQIVRSLPQALAVMLDPADCGPAFFALPQDVQAEAYDYPASFFEPRVHYIRRPGPDARDIEAAAALLARRQEAVDHRRRRRALLRCCRGAHRVRRATWHPGRRDAGRQVDARPRPPELRRTRRRHRIGGSERRRGGCRCRAGDRDPAAGLHDGIVGAVQESRRCGSCRSTPLGGMPTSSTPRRSIGDALVAIDAARRRARPTTPRRPSGSASPRPQIGEWHGYLDSIRQRPSSAVPSYGQVIQVINEVCDDDDYIVSAAGGLPGELVGGWRSKSVGSFDTEFGFSTMGYEIAGGLGAKMAQAGHRRARVRRRRLVPDDEQRHLFDGVHRAQGDLHHLRQRRLRLDQQPAGQPGRRLVQQHAQHRPACRR